VKFEPHISRNRADFLLPREEIPLGTSGFPASVLLNTPANCTPIRGDFNAMTQRFDIPSQAIVLRSACAITSAVAARVVTLSGVPAGAAFTIAGDASLSGAADASGTLALTFGAAGTYTVAVACFPALDYSGSFTLA
jgi:environmental stress-induced protein Ves